MTIAERAVTVRQLPRILNAKQRRLFLRDVQNSMAADRPRVVLDCSRLREFDSPIGYLLLCCLEEAMKRNGDVKLAALPAGAGAILKLNGVGGLFDVYDTTADAVSSFHKFPAGAVVQPPEPLRSHRGPESAA